MKPTKVLMIIIGSISLVLGVIAAFIPVLPSFPFLLLTSILFARSSEKLTKWFISTKVYKNNLQNFLEKKGMTKTEKLKSCILLCLTFGIGMYFTRDTQLLVILLGVILIFHLYYFIFKVKDL